MTRLACPCYAPRMPGRVAGLFRYPVKGLGPQSLERVALATGRALPDDRRWALARVAGVADPGPVAWTPRGAFAQRHNTPALAAITTDYDTPTTALRLTAPDGTSRTGRLDTPAGRRMLTTFLADRLGLMAPSLRLVDARGAQGEPIAFTDMPEPLVSLIGLASVRDLERAVGTAVDPARLRANLWVDDLPAWHEFDWEGRTLRIGSAILRVVAPITRCAAIDAGATGTRDLPLLATLRQRFRHEECGVYAEVMHGGDVQIGDAIDRL